jgi:hypothetical protein
MQPIDRLIQGLALSTSDNREETVKTIIKDCLFINNNEKVSVENLSNLIIKNYGIEIYPTELEEIINVLLDKTEIRGVKQFCLSDETYKLFESQKSKYQDNELKRYNNFINLLNKEVISQNLTPDEQKKIWDNFQLYLYNNFFEYGETAVKFLNPSFNGDENFNVETSVYKFLEKLNDAKLKKIFISLVENYIKNINDDELNFLNDLANKTLSFKSLGLPKELHEIALEKNVIDWIIYVDTNFLFSLLDLHSNDNAENWACKQLWNAIDNNQIKIKFRVLARTMAELNLKERELNKLLPQKGDLRPSEIKAMLKSNNVDSFSKKYLEQLIENPESAIHPSIIITTAKAVLSKKFKIELAKENYEHLEEGNHIDNVVKEYSNYIVDNNILRQNEGFRPIDRTEKQIYHDIFLREVSLEARKKIGIKNPQTLNDVRFFGITIDKNLIKFDNYLLKKHKQTYPTFFLPSHLLNRIVRLLPIQTNDYKKAFISAISSYNFNADVRTTKDIIDIVHYLRSQGIEDESIILNFISEKVFISKFKQEQNQGTVDAFYEAEINKLYSQKEKDLEQVRQQLIEQQQQLLSIQNQFEQKNIDSQNQQTIVNKLIEQNTEVSKQYQLMAKELKKINQKPKPSKEPNKLPELPLMETALMAEKRKNFEDKRKNFERLQKIKNKSEQYAENISNIFFYFRLIALLIIFIGIIYIITNNDWNILEPTTFIFSTFFFGAILDNLYFAMVGEEFIYSPKQYKEITKKTALKKVHNFYEFDIQEYNQIKSEIEILD